MFLQKGGGEILQILDGVIIRFRPIHGEIKAVFIALGGIGEIARIRAVGNHEDLQEFEERIVAVETLLAITVYLIKSLANRHATFL